MAGRNEFGSAEEFYAYRKNLLMNETNLETLIRKYDRLASGFDQVTPSSVLFLIIKLNHDTGGFQFYFSTKFVFFRDIGEIQSRYRPGYIYAFLFANTKWVFFSEPTF